MPILCNCSGQMYLVSRLPLVTLQAAKNLAIQELGQPKKVKTRRKRKLYLKVYRRKLHKLMCLKFWGLCIAHQVAGKHYKCSSCGTTEGMYSGLSHSVFTKQPLMGFSICQQTLEK